MFCPACRSSSRGLTEPLGRTLVFAAAALLAGCGENGLFPSTVDQGTDFNVAEVVFDENYFYCKVEPELFGHRCGPGDTGQGDAANSCHYNVTSFRLSDYTPL